MIRLMHRVSGHLRKNVVICKNFFTRVIFVEKWQFKKKSLKSTHFSEAWKNVDINGDGEVSYEEFIGAIVQRKIKNY